MDPLDVGIPGFGENGVTKVTAQTAPMRIGVDIKMHMRRVGARNRRWRGLWVMEEPIAERLHVV